MEISSISLGFVLTHLTGKKKRAWKQMTSVHSFHMAAEACGILKLIYQLSLLDQIFHRAEFCRLDKWISSQGKC